MIDQSQTVERLVRRVRWRLCGLVAAVAVADFVFGAVFVAFLQRAGVSAVAIGALLAMAGGVSTLVEAPSGAFGDRYGQRRITVIGLLMWGAGQMLFGMSGQVWQFIAVLLLWAAGMACYSGAPYALAVGYLREAGADDAMMPSLVRAAQVTRWVAAGAGALAVMVSVAVPLGAVVSISGAGMLLTAGWVAVAWPESEIRSSTPVLETLIRGVRLVAHGELRLVALCTALSAAATATVLVGWQPLALAAGLPERYLGLQLLAMIALAAGGALLSVRIRIEPAHATAITILGMSVLLGLAGIAGGVTALVLVAMVEIGVGLSGSTVGVWEQAAFPDDLRNTLMSILGVVAGLSMATVDLIFGAIWQGPGLSAAIGGCGAAIAVLTFVVAPTLWTSTLDRTSTLHSDRMPTEAASAVKEGI
jgi:MFS family permease